VRSPRKSRFAPRPAAARSLHALSIAAMANESSSDSDSSQTDSIFYDASDILPPALSSPSNTHSIAPSSTLKPPDSVEKRHKRHHHRRRHHHHRHHKHSAKEDKPEAIPKLITTTPSSESVSSPQHSLGMEGVTSRSKLRQTPRNFYDSSSLTLHSGDSAPRERRSTRGTIVIKF
jgi:hypothetical protein